MTYNVFGGTLNLAQLNSTVPQPVRLLFCCRLRPSGIISAAMQVQGLLWRWYPDSCGTIPTCRWDSVQFSNF